MTRAEPSEGLGIPFANANCALVIMGAAVWAGGAPSNAMKRRVRGALASGAACERSTFIVSGALGGYPPSEARAMAALLGAAGVPLERIILDEQSTDTIQSVRTCSKIIAEVGPFSRVIVCTDTYHSPRCRWLFSLCGVRSEPGLVANGRSETPLGRWIYFCLREVPALPWDTLVLLLSRLTKPGR